ncbi:hypothetical protein F4780DRAFT_778394 [Xylariomycetidae sp. FL0641]|nr:hypothetical protein F4780DRAFT_778394 [Xylariomycetidae sp. FL0641]
MRFLCLHGMGTSGAIFKVQTSFRARLPAGRHSFTFIDAPFACGASRSLSPFFPGPHYAFVRDYSSAAEVEAAPRFVLGLLEEADDPPYDALLCFSQGCAVAAGLLLALRVERRARPLPVRGVVFVCGGVPLPLLELWGLRVPPQAWHVNDVTGRDLQRKAALAGAEIAALMARLEGGGGGGDEEETQQVARPPLVRGRSLWSDTSTLYHQAELRKAGARGSESGEDKSERLDPKELPPLAPDDVYGLDLSDIPDYLTIDIPTVHIYGMLDPRYPAAVQLAWMCNPEKRRVFDTGGGHEIPRSSYVSREIAEAISWLDTMVSNEAQ